MKHTAGPWDYIKSRTLIHVETRHDNPAGAGIHVCSVPFTSEGDAALIAATPCLKRALENLVRKIERDNLNTTHGLDLSEAREALNAALITTKPL